MKMPHLARFWMLGPGMLSQSPKSLPLLQISTALQNPICQNNIVSEMLDTRPVIYSALQNCSDGVPNLPFAMA